MAFSFANSPNTYEVWNVTGISGNVFVGAAIKGASSLAEGVILFMAPGFTGAIVSVSILVTSGTFTGSETVNVTGNVTGGGSFAIAATSTSSVTQNTIHVTGSSVTASGSLSAEAIDISETEIDVDDENDFGLGDVLLIDSEYMYVVLATRNATDLITVKRGYWGSTPATHLDNVAIDIVDKDLFQQIYDASVTNVWGYESLSSGRLQLNCNVMIGDAYEAAAVTLALSTGEAVQLLDCHIVGHEDYYTRFFIGEGELDEPQSFRNGSIVLCQLGTVATGLSSVRFGQLFAYACNLLSVSSVDRAILARCNFGAAPVGYITPAILGLQNGTECDGITDLYDLVISKCNFAPSSPRVTYDKIIIGDVDYGVYFLTSGSASPEIWNCELLNCWTGDAFAFADAGNKQFFNSIIDVNSIGRFWSAATFENSKTVDITTVNKTGTAIPGVNIKCFDSTQNPLTDTPLFDVNTGVGGDIAQQIVLVSDKYFVAPPARFYGPFKFYITKIGWADIIIVDSMDVQVDWRLQMQDIDLNALGS